MQSLVSIFRRRGRGTGFFLCALISLNSVAVEPKRVLILHSFGQEFAPYNAFSGNFRTELAKQLGGLVDFHDVALETARFEGGTEEGPFVNYLLALFARRKLDLVVPVGGPAARFAQRYRSRLFPGTPMLVAATDQRIVQSAVFTTNDTMVAVANDLPRTIDGILQLLPETTRIIVVLGNSPLEKFWLGEMRREFAVFTNRLNFEWFNELPFAEMLNRSRTLPPGSAIYYVLLAVDADGVPETEERALADLHAVANAPIFGIQDSQMSRGIVGGPLVPIEELSRNTAKVAVRILRGEAPAGIHTPPLGLGQPVYDWRELRRWGISEARLPAGSSVLFREPTFWERYRWHITAVGGLCVAEAALIVLLVANAMRRRRAEGAMRDLSGRLIHAQEEERARLARELHDDVTQRLARLAIDAGNIERDANARGVAQTLRGVREGLVQLSEDVHALSYRVHPSILEDLGLAEALRVECERSTRQGFCLVELKCGGAFERVPQDAALCLFRVAQESLRNAARHAQARSVEVTLRRTDGGLQVAIQDDGVGFDPTQPRQRPSLGLAGMRERVRLLRGDLDIETAPGHGTTVVAWVPLETARNSSA